LNGDAFVSLAYVGAAIRDGKDGVMARYLLARSRESVEPASLVLEAHPGGAYAASFSPDGALLVTAGEDGGVSIWDARSGARLHRLEGHHGPVLAAEWSPDGRIVASAGLDGVVRLWDARTGGKVASLEGHRGYVPGARFSPGGDLLATWDLFGEIR